MNSYIYALGFFDGVHVGHQALLNACKKLAEQYHCLPSVVTFGSHPDTLVLGSTPALINTPEDRERILRRYGIQKVVTLPFDQKMCSTDWQDFLKMLEQDYQAIGFICGEDFRFGRKGIGTAQMLQDYCAERNMPCAVIPDQILDGTRISSTHIRTLIEQGKMEWAEQFLGHPHILTGNVVHGKQLGRTLGIPTANLLLPNGLVIPKFGVYACRSLVDGSLCPAVTNIGTRPTVNGTGITVEPWLLDYQGDLYGKEITLEFYRFLRPEQCFPSLEALQEEIRRNAEQTRAFFTKF